MAKHYVLSAIFKDLPECKICILGRYTARNLEGNSIMMCQGLPLPRTCPDEGCRKDCPLTPVGEMESKV